MNQLDKNKKILLNVYPGILIAVLLVASYVTTDIVKANEVGFYIFTTSIYLIIPMSFFGQGIFCRRYRENVAIALACSMVLFLVAMGIAFVTFPIAFAVFYAVFGFIGYGIYYLYEMLITMRNKKGNNYRNKKIG
ncbi:hypothetical protein lbkm_3882 [Lachnospiraceae bacterium KM106-2]|nr:hypothetical protein lbkm_3882 [Lachnospiraceae bacterium KM106-2]